MFGDPDFAHWTPQSEYSWELWPQDDAKMPPKREPRRSRMKKCRVRFRLHETPPDGALGAPKINLFRDLLLTPFRDPVFFGPGPPDSKQKWSPG